MNIGEKLQNRRKELGLTLQAVGDACGVTKSTVQKWETGHIANMRRDRLTRLAQILEVSVDFILGGENFDADTDEMQEYLTLLRERPEMKMLFSVSKKASKEDIEKTVRIIEALKTKSE
ncbi:MAG: helix-turn-helix transcriptional regulator [Clostridia bacterium]|nr:helix-turn-helix transcriptional regulator [Clostridia bacterium]